MAPAAGDATARMAPSTAPATECFMIGPPGASQRTSARYAPAVAWTRDAASPLFWGYRSGGRRTSCRRSAADRVEKLAASRLVLRERSRERVESQAIDHARVFLAQQVGELVVRSLHGVHVEHLVRDESAHAAPVALGGLLVQAIAGLTPAVRLENADVGARRCIESELRAHGGLGALEIGARLPGD